MTKGSSAQRLRGAKHIVVFTGAGASAESGIPTFRDALTGLWGRVDPAQLATPETFRADPSLCWGGMSGAGGMFSKRSRMERISLSPSSPGSRAVDHERPDLILASPFLRTQETALATTAIYQDAALETWPVAKNAVISSA